MSLRTFKSAVHYRVVRDHGFARAATADNALAPPGTPPWSLYWYGGPLDVRTVHGLLPFQRVSKFPAAHNLTLKANLWRHFARMQAVHGQAHFGFMPPSYVLPAELGRWRAAAAAGHADDLFIVKPNNASRSRGIYLVRGGAQRDQDGKDRDRVVVKDTGEPSSPANGSGGPADGAEGHPPLSEGGHPPLSEVHGVVCRYLRPYLLDGRKFDLRLYALVTSWCPLVVYLHSGGIARLEILKIKDYASKE